MIRIIFLLSLMPFMFAAVIKNGDVIVEKKFLSWSELRDVGVVKQEYDYSCGSASLSTILKYYYGLHIGEKEVLDDILSSKGVDLSKKSQIEQDLALKKQIDISFLDLSDYVSKKGFRSLGLALDLETLSKLKIPVIVYVKVRDNEHFTVYKGMDSHYVYLADPSFGNIKVSISKFQEMFYQRDNLNHPGKILAILPDSTYTNVQQDFMNVKFNARFFDDIIKEKSIK